MMLAANCVGDRTSDDAVGVTCTFTPQNVENTRSTIVMDNALERGFLFAGRRTMHMQTQSGDIIIGTLVIVGTSNAFHLKVLWFTLWTR